MPDELNVVDHAVDVLSKVQGYACIGMTERSTRALGGPLPEGYDGLGSACECSCEDALVSQCAHGTSARVSLCAAFGPK